MKLTWGLLLVGALFVAPVAAAQANWYNPAFDKTFHLASIGKRQVDDIPKQTQDDIRDPISLLLFALGTSPGFRDNLDPVWAAYTAMENCAEGVKAAKNLADEFGDRKAGKAAITAARERFRAWAATQTPTLKLYGTATLGKYVQEQGAFLIDRKPWLASMPDKKAGGMVDGPYMQPYVNNGGRFGFTFVDMRSLNVLCPDTTKPNSWVTIGMSTSVMLAVRKQFNENEGYQLKPLKMDADAAREFVARNPERKVTYEFTVAPLGSTAYFRPPNVGMGPEIYKTVYVTHLVVKDKANGAVLFDESYGPPA